MKMKANTAKILRKSIALIAAAITVVSLFTLAACNNKGTNNDIPNGESSSVALQKTVDFKIVLEDKSEKTVHLKTQKETLAEALVEAGIIEYSSDGFYTTIDGVTADFNKDGSWWCITKGGETLNYGLNDLKIADGETYEATYTK